LLGFIPFLIAMAISIWLPKNPAIKNIAIVAMILSAFWVGYDVGKDLAVKP